LIVAAIDGLLLTRIDGRQPNWLRPGKLLGQLLDAQLLK
jgi:hypothetical protein